jgi:hypothetical protein
LPLALQSKYKIKRPQAAIKGGSFSKSFHFYPDPASRPPMKPLPTLDRPNKIRAMAQDGV